MISPESIQALRRFSLTRAAFVAQLTDDQRDQFDRLYPFPPIPNELSVAVACAFWFAARGLA
jgi:hypothetical protein